MGVYIQRYRKNKRIFTDKGLVEDKQLFWKELIFFSVLFVFLTWIIFYVFYIKDGILYFRIYRVRRLCAPYGNDAVFFFCRIIFLPSILILEDRT